MTRADLQETREGGEFLDRGYQCLYIAEKHDHGRDAVHDFPLQYSANGLVVR